MGSTSRLAAAIVWGVGLLTCAALAPSAAAGAGTARIVLAAAAVATAAHLALLCLDAAGGRREARLAIGVALLAHAVLLAAPPLFSDDIYRYAFDGTLSRHGLAPWAWAPSSPKVADLAAPWLGHINHAELPTIYPPVAQAVFAIGAVPWAAVGAIRLLVWLLFAAGCALMPERRHGVAIFTHPLAALAVASDGHIDALAIPLVALALRAGVHRPGRLGAALGLAAGVKLFPVALAAGVLGKGGLRRGVLAGVVACVVLGATYLPVAHMGTRAVGSLGTYATTWRFHGALEPVAAAGIEAALRATDVPDPTAIPWQRRRREQRGAPRWIDGEPHLVEWRAHAEVARGATKALGAVLFGIVALVLWRRRASLATSCSGLTLALLLVSPVVHPWYALWLLPWALAARDRIAMVACATVILGYHAAAAELDGGVWTDAPLWRAATWLPVAAAFAVRLVRSRRNVTTASLTVR